MFAVRFAHSNAFGTSQTRRTLVAIAGKKVKVFGMKHYKIKIIIILFLVLISVVSCRSSAIRTQVVAEEFEDSTGQADSYYGFAKRVVIGKTKAEDIQKVFGSPLGKIKIGRYEETGQPLEMWGYLSMGEKKSTVAIKMAQFYFNEKTLLENFFVLEGEYESTDEVIPDSGKFRRPSMSIKIGQTTKKEVVTKLGFPNIKAIIGRSEITGARAEVWMYFIKMGEAGGGFLSIAFDDKGIVFNHITIGVEDIQNIKSIFGNGSK